VELENLDRPFGEVGGVIGQFSQQRLFEMAAAVLELFEFGRGFGTRAVRDIGHQVLRSRLGTVRS